MNLLLLTLLSNRLKWAMDEESKRRGHEVKPADLARAAGTSAASVTHWLSDANGIGAAKARLLGAYLNVDPLWLETGEGAPTPKHPPLRRADDKKLSNVTAIHPDDQQPDEVVYVPESRIEFSGGNGRIHYELIEDEEPATYRLSWFQKYGINPDRVRRFRVSGDSMVPMLYPRDTILVNTDETNIIDGKLYAIRYGDELRVKFLSRRLDGTVILRSVNPLYQEEVIPADVAQEHISVIGRVRDRSGTGGL